MESTNGQVRPMPGYGNRNGLPESGGYVYRGWGEDIMPWAVTSDTSMNYDRGDLPPEPRHPKPKVKGPGRGKCQKCGYGSRSKNHFILCD